MYLIFYDDFNIFFVFVCVSECKNLVVHFGRERRLQLHMVLFIATESVCWANGLVSDPEH